MWLDWRSPLVFVKPTTVIDWHRRVFRRYFRWRSRKPGRLRIPDEHIALIRRISRDHPEWGEDRIAEELAIKLAVKHSTSTIRKYMVRRRLPAIASIRSRFGARVRSGTLAGVVQSERASYDVVFASDLMGPHWEHAGERKQAHSKRLTRSQKLAA